MDEPGAQRRILVIDDDPGLIEVLTDGLRMLGDYEVIEARDGATGLAQFFEARPACVVVDVRMPGLDGYQFVRALRGDAATASTPIVVLSALVQDREQLAGLLSGADAYLLKPVKLVDLLRTIEDTIRLSLAERAEQGRLLAGDASATKEG
ncbi:MAG TPA: response regulator [Ktedonobacterales bacterium]|jgi:two-component system alkaline phosphatase synthesis response regulator PhoP|nr:response regulator [Ktedonobacterales bacterium]